MILDNLAVGSSRGVTALYCNHDNHGDNRLYPDALLGVQISCAVTTLDELRARHHIGACDFLKIDVRGCEMRVLEGASEWLRSSEDCVLMTEFRPRRLRRAGSDPARHFGELKRHGFRPALIHGPRVGEFDDARLVWGTPGRKYRSIAGYRGCAMPQSRL